MRTRKRTAGGDMRADLREARAYVSDRHRKLHADTENWIPIEGVHEVDLIQALTEQKRRFMKPLRYDARSVASFPNVLSTRYGCKAHTAACSEATLNSQDRAAKEKALKAAASRAWVWHTDKKMPPLPEAAPLTTSEK